MRLKYMGKMYSPKKKVYYIMLLGKKALFLKTSARKYPISFYYFSNSVSSGTIWAS